MRSVSYAQLAQTVDQVLVSQDLKVDRANQLAVASRLRGRLAVVGIYDDIFAMVHAGASSDDVVAQFNLVPRGEVEKMYQKAQSEIGPQGSEEAAEVTPISDEHPQEAIASMPPNTKSDIKDVLAERVIEHLARLRAANLDQMIQRTQIKREPLLATLKELG